MTNQIPTFPAPAAAPTAAAALAAAAAEAVNENDTAIQRLFESISRDLASQRIPLARYIVDLAAKSTRQPTEFFVESRSSDYLIPQG